MKRKMEDFKMNLENENTLENEVKNQQAEGTVHMRTDEEDPVETPQAELPTQPEEIVDVDLFGVPIAPPTKSVKLPPAVKPTVAKPTTAKATPAAKAEPAKPKEPEKFGIDYQYAYAGHVGNLPQEDMTLEDIRQFLQVDFPELSKERTRMEVDTETKYIIPIVKGTKSG